MDRSRSDSGVPPSRSTSWRLSARLSRYTASACVKSPCASATRPTLSSDTDRSRSLDPSGFAWARRLASDSAPRATCSASPGRPAASSSLLAVQAVGRNACSAADAVAIRCHSANAGRAPSAATSVANGSTVTGTDVGTASGSQRNSSLRSRLCQMSGAMARVSARKWAGRTSTSGRFRSRSRRKRRSLRRARNSVRARFHCASPGWR